MRYSRRIISLLLLLLAALFLSVLFLSDRTVWADSDPVSVPIDEEHFQDERFRKYLSEMVDTNQDGLLSPEERGDVRVIKGKYGTPGRCSLKELLLFPNVEELWIELLIDAKDKDININAFSKMTKLRSVYMEVDLIGIVEEFRLSNLPNISSIYIGSIYQMDNDSFLNHETDIKEMTVTNCPQLVKFEIGEGLALDLKIDNCERLEIISGGCITFKKLELSNLISLQHLYFVYGPSVIVLRENVALDKKDIRRSEIYENYDQLLKERKISRGDAALRYTVVIDSVCDNKRFGWHVFENGKTAYVDEDYNPANGFREIDGKLYYFYGHLLPDSAGWYEVDGRWYLVNEKGCVQTGWRKWKGKWYLLGEDGAMKTRWQLVDGKWYFMRDNGMMLRSEYIQGYWLNKDGSCTYKPVAKWKEDSVGLYYQDTSGYYVRNTKVFIDRNWYLFDKRGYVIDFEVAPEGDFRFDY